MDIHRFFARCESAVAPVHSALRLLPYEANGRPARLWMRRACLALVALLPLLNAADVVTTALELARPGGREVDPYAAVVLARWGLGGLVVVKALIVAAVMVAGPSVWRSLPRFALAAFVILNLWGLLVVANNLFWLAR